MNSKPPETAAETQTPVKRSPSMHEGTPIWDDCCTCAAEPYWLEIGEQLEREAAQRRKQEAKP